MSIKEQLQPVWEQVVKVENRYANGYIGTDIQNDLEDNIRPLLPQGIGYIFDWNMSGDAKHIFYEIGNENNKLVF